MEAISGPLYGGHTKGSTTMSLTPTEIAREARAAHAGADQVTVRDRGETDPRSGKIIRDFDQVTIKVGRETIEIMRDHYSESDHGTWQWQSTGIKKPGSAHTVVHDQGVITGTGDVLRAIESARERQGLPAPAGTRRPFTPGAFKERIRP